MLEYLRRSKNLQGLPRVEQRTSEAFFDLLEADNTDRARQIGELYFEYHRGTYTTQAATKRGNRLGEVLLHDAEFLSVAAARTKGQAYPADTIGGMWRVLLLNQFHDILPGSSITLVYEDAARDLRPRRGGPAAAHRQRRPRARRPGRGRGGLEHDVVRPRRSRRRPGRRALCSRRPRRTASAGRRRPDDKVVVTETADGVVLENARLRATLGRDGTLVGLVEKSTGRETMSAPGNLLLTYPDTPTCFDAWDVDPFHLEKETVAGPSEACTVVERHALRAGVAFERKVGRASTVKQVVRLSAGAGELVFENDIDWREDHVILKAAFPVNVRAMNATYDMQFGPVERPTHFNTSYDLARYEVPGHKWSDLSEPGFGVALLSDSKYGYSTFGNVMRLSLLRAPTYPDPTADRGRHRFRYALRPHAGDWREGGVVAAGTAFNVPLYVLANSSAAEKSFASVDAANVVLDTIKKAEDGDGIVLRLYEAHGARGTTRVRVGLPFTTATFANALEDETGPAVAKDGVIELPYGPYQIVTLVLR